MLGAESTCERQIMQVCIGVHIPEIPGQAWGGQGAVSRTN